MVLVADSVPLFSESVAEALRIAQGLSVLEEYPRNGPSAIAAAARTRPAVALVDYWLPDMDGCVVARHIRREVPECSVILLSSMSGAALIKQAAAAGAAAFVPKQWGLARLQKAIEVVQEQREGAGPALQKTPGLAPQGEELKAFDSLSPAEIEVLGLLSSGATVKEIADRLNITQGTVRNRISRILRKTDTRSSRGAVAKARSVGFLRS